MTASLGRQEPRLRLVPDYVSSAGEEAIELCELAGLHLDPWEQLVLTDMLGERPDGKWASFEFGVIAPRQNGKDAIFEGRELTGLFLLNEKLIIHSAHEQATASEHFRRLLELIEGVPEFEQRILKAPRGKGAESIELRGGQRIFFKTRTAGGGRGLSGDLVVLNEAMILPGTVMGALVPTMAARSLHGNPQLLYGGSAVDQQIHEHGVTLSRLRVRAMAGVPRIGLCEWSADVKVWREAHGLKWDEDIPEIEQVTAALLADPDVWAEGNPGLGIRISSEHIANEHAGALGTREFTVERLGIGDWPSPEEEAGVITMDQWDALVDERSIPLDPVCFAFDVTPNRAISSIGVCGLRTDGLEHVEVVEEAEGTGWVVLRLAQLVAKHKSVAVVCDSRSAAASLIPELEALKIEVTTTSTEEFSTACGMFFDGVVDQQNLRHRGHDDLRSSIKGAAKRPIGDAGAWVWSYKGSSSNIASLRACTLALWGRRTIKPKKKVPKAVFA